MSATCYLPLSDNLQIEKELGTRHRAAIGMSESSDSITLVVSEETGDISIAMNGRLYRGLDIQQIKKRLHVLKNTTQDKPAKFKLWQVKSKNEKSN